MRSPPTAYEEELLARAAAWPGHASWKGLTADALRSISDCDGVDFATTLLYERIVHSPEHGSFLERVQRGTSCRPVQPGVLVIVPGAGYVEYPQTGADGRRLRECVAAWGWQIETVPVASFGSLPANARAVTEWLARRPDEPVVLVSLSKGGADVKTALAMPEAATAFRNVSVWISLNGIIHGTPLAGWFLGRWFRRLLIRILCWYRGVDVAVLRELVRDESGPLAPTLHLPPGLRVIHVVGFPLSCHLRSRRSRRGHRRLAAFGPNDGSILLGDLCRLPGVIYPVWGADHYMKPGWDVQPLIRQILLAALDDWHERATTPARQVQEV